MQYAIFDNVTQEYFCEDGTWMSVRLDQDVVTTDKDIQLYRDDDKAIAKIAELKAELLALNPAQEIDFALHSLDREVCYILEPVLNNAVLAKVEAVNRA
jgi:hypothetical protein